MTADALLAAIRADPDGDLPRLVYADHLDDAGDAARAEFIRVQCELARLDEADPRRPGLEDREHDLLDRHEPAWLGGLGDVDEWEWRRGFVDEVSGTLGSLDRLGGGGFAGHPVRAVNCTYWLDGPAGIVPPDVRGRPWMAGLRRLSLTAADISPGHLQALVRSPYLANLTAFDVSQNPGVGRLAEVLAGASFLGGLRELSAGGSPRPELGPPATLDASRLARVLAAAPLERLHLPGAGVSCWGGLGDLLAGPFGSRVTALDLSDNPLRFDEALAFDRLPADAALGWLDLSGTNANWNLGRILACPGLGRLTGLELNRGDRPDFGALVETGFWPRATALRLHSCVQLAGGLNPLCSTPGSTRLRLLDLADNNLRPAGVRRLLGAEWGETLTWLALSRNRVGDESAGELADSGRYQRLRTLHLAFNHITNHGAAALAGSPTLACLRLLTLSNTRITDRSVPALLDAPHWRLSGLGLAGCDLSEHAVHALATSQRLHRLQWLDLSGNPRLGGDALLPLAESPHLSRLCELDVGGVDASDRVRDALRQRLGRRLSD